MEYPLIQTYEAEGEGRGRRGGEMGPVAATALY
jgi:hypothetical protein